MSLKKTFKEGFQRHGPSPFMGVGRQMRSSCEIPSGAPLEALQLLNCRASIFFNRVSEAVSRFLGTVVLNEV